MKKSLLLIVPALFSLCACNPKREISVEEAALITKKIDAEYLNIKNYKVVYNISNTRGKGNSFEEELVNSQMMINDDWTFYLKSVNSRKGMFELYHAFDPIYEEIYYKFSEKDENIEHEGIVRKDNPNTEDFGCNYKSTAVGMESLFIYYFYPNLHFFHEDNTLIYVETENYKYSYSFESDRENYFSIKIGETLKESVTDPEVEKIRYRETFLEYNNFRLTHCAGHETSTFLNECSLDVHISYSETPYKITLPQGWENNISK